MPGKGKVTFPVMRSTSFSVGSGRGMAAVGDHVLPFKHFPTHWMFFKTRDHVWSLNAASLEAVRPFLVCESRTLTHSARLLVQMDTWWTHRPWLHTRSWHSVIALSKIINGKLSVLRLQSDSLNFMSKTYMKDPSCILHRAGYQHSFSQRTRPFPPPIYFLLFEMVITHYFDPLNFPRVQLFSLIQMEIPDFLLKWAN